MSQNSVVGQVGHTVVNAFTGASGSGEADAVSHATTALQDVASQNNKQPAQNPAPNVGQATQDALQQQVQQEVGIRASRTLFAGAGGLLDSPNLASRVLLGE